MAPLTTAGEVVYPESDGKPMAESSKQGRWIRLLVDNLDALFASRQDVFVSGDQFWYPVEGDNQTVQAPDVYVIFGRPKGDRGSYKQWLENDIPMTVVFEVLSPSNTPFEMADKLDFYDMHGVEEYYVYDPERNDLSVYVRRKAALVRLDQVDGFVSPRLGIRFQMTQPEMTVFHPDGELFKQGKQLKAERNEERRRAQDAQRERDDAQQRADDAQQRASDAQQRADDAEKRAEILERIAILSRRVRRGVATEAEMQELDRLEQESALSNGDEEP